MDSSGLKACPHCGYPPSVNSTKSAYWLTCTCGATTQKSNSLRIVADAWNRRFIDPDNAALAERVGVLERALGEIIELFSFEYPIPLQAEGVARAALHQPDAVQSEEGR